MKTKEQVSRYEEIAFLIAKRIVNGEFKESDKLSGRSLLSSEYNVSSETIRKAMQLLSNYDAVKVIERSGIYVYSKMNASYYIEYFNQHKANKHLISETFDLLEQTSKINHDLQKNIKKMIQVAEQNNFPFNYFTFEIEDDSKWIGKSLASLNFYQHTNGMIIGIEEEGILNQVPSPDTLLKSDMILFILGNEEVKDKTNKYLK